MKLIGHLHNPIAWIERHFCGKVSAWFIYWHLTITVFTLNENLYRWWFFISPGLLFFSERTGDSSNRQREESMNHILFFSVVFGICQSSCIFLSFIYIQKKKVFQQLFPPCFSPVVELLSLHSRSCSGFRRACLFRIDRRSRPGGTPLLYRVSVNVLGCPSSQGSVGQPWEWKVCTVPVEGMRKRRGYQWAQGSRAGSGVAPWHAASPAGERRSRGHLASPLGADAVPGLKAQWCPGHWPEPHSWARAGELDWGFAVPPSWGGAGAASLLWCAHFCHRLTFRKESFCW